MRSLTVAAGVKVEAAEVVEASEETVEVAAEATEEEVNSILFLKIPSFHPLK